MIHHGAEIACIRDPPTAQRRRRSSSARNAPTANDERQTLIEFLRFNQNAFFAVAYGSPTSRRSAVGERPVDRRARQARRGRAARLDGARQGGTRPPAARRAAVRGAGGRLRGRVRRRRLESCWDKRCARRTRTPCGSSPRPTSTPRCPSRTMCRGSHRTWTSGTCAGSRCTSSRS